MKFAVHNSLSKFNFQNFRSYLVQWGQKSGSKTQMASEKTRVPSENTPIFSGTILSLQFLPADHRTLPFSRVYLLISTNSLIPNIYFWRVYFGVCPLKEMTNLKLIIVCKYAVSVKYFKNHKQIYIITLSECIILCTQLTVVERS